MIRRDWLMVSMMALVAIATICLVTGHADAGALEDAIAKTPTGKEPGMIDPQAPKGFLGIPGAPSPFWLWGVFWGCWVGWVFSVVGAFGGIMAGVGHMSVFGLGTYAQTFKKTNPTLNKLITDSIRMSNQFLVGLSALISSTTYYRMGRLVLPLGLALAVGGIAAGYLIPVLTGGKITLSQYMGYFGITVLVIGAFLFYETTPRGQASKKAAKEAAAAFEKEHIHGSNSSGHAGEKGVRVTHWGIPTRFTFYGVEFPFNPLLALVGGFVINAVSSFIGVGGGFLYVPYLTSIVGLPMYIVAGTSAFAVLVGMISSIYTYMFVKSVPADLLFIGAELIGIAIGSIIGPMTSKRIPDVWLKRLFVVLALYVGIGYTLRGFFDIRLPGI